MKKLLLYIALLSLCGVAQAATFTITWQNPTSNTDGSALTDLSSIELEWGTCSGSAFGTRTGGALIATTEVGKAMSYRGSVQGLAKVCVRAFAYNAQGAKSDSSNVASKVFSLPTPGKPVTLDQPVILQFN